MYCKNCGILMEDDANFCIKCGTAVTRPNIQPEAEEKIIATEVEANAEVEIKAEVETNNEPAGLVPVRMVYVEKPATPSVPGKGNSIAAMALGIASLAMWFIFYMALPMAITGLILGISSQSKASKAGMKNSMAKTGIICSSVGIVLSLVFITIFVLSIVFA